MTTHYDRVCSRRRAVECPWWCDSRGCAATFEDDIVFHVSAWGARYCAACFDIIPPARRASIFHCDWRSYYCCDAPSVDDSKSRKWYVRRLKPLLPSGCALDGDIGWFTNRLLNRDLCIEHAAQILDARTNKDPHGITYVRARAIFERLESTRMLYRTVTGTLLPAEPVRELVLPDALLSAYRSDVLRCATAWRLPVLMWSYVDSINEGERDLGVSVAQGFGSIRAWVPFDSYSDPDRYVITAATKREGMRLRDTRWRPTNPPWVRMWALVNCDPSDASASGGRHRCRARRCGGRG